VGPAELARVKAEDRALLAPVVQADAEGFFAEAMRQRDRNRICGLSPIYAVLRLLSGGPGRLLHYGQWPDPDGTVTFASVSFGQEAPSP
jgi:predicted class III extradiol MEMO1 family dioxygenase